MQSFGVFVAAHVNKTRKCVMAHILLQRKLSSNIADARILLLSPLLT